MRAQSWILIIIALGCGLVASIGISQVMDRGEAKDGNEQEYESIFTAVVDIPTGNPITPQMIKLEKWPKDKLPAGVITELDKIEKRRPRSAIIKGEPILEGKLIGKDDKGAIEQLSEGFQAVAIKVTAEDISGGLVKPGDRVNVLVYFQKGDEIPETGIRTLLRNVRCFAIGSEVEREENEGKVINAATVTLELNERDAALITLAQQKGRIRLTLRRPDDKAPTDQEDPLLTMKDILGGESEATHDPNKSITLPPLGPAPTVEKPSADAVLRELASGQPAEPAEKPFRMTVTEGPKRTNYDIPKNSDPIEVGTTGITNPTLPSLPAPVAPAPNTSAGTNPTNEDIEN